LDKIYFHKKLGGFVEPILRIIVRYETWHLAGFQGKLWFNRLMKRAAIPAMLLIWAILNLLPLVTHPDNGPMPLVAQQTDFFDTHLPITRYVHDTLTQYGYAPVWNAAILSGQPFAADPLSGYWYLPNWLTFWQPQPWMFTLLFLLHLFWTGWGMFILMRSENAGRSGALLAAVAWMATPRLIGYIGGGQISMVYALAWTPWLLLAFRKAAQDPSLRRTVLAAGCLAVTFLADVRWGFLGGLFAAAYAMAHFHFSRANLRRAIPAAVVGAALFLVLTAGLTLPMLEFLGYSSRASLASNDIGAYSIQPFGLLGLLIPPYGMLYELVVYLGWLPLLLAVMGAAQRKWFWLAAALAAALYSLGTSSFFFPLLLKILPGVSLLRVPSRAWFITALCVAALAGWGVDGFLESLKAVRSRRWIEAGSASLLIILTAANLSWYNASQLTGAPISNSTLANWLESQPGLFRVYSPDGSIPMPNSLQQANGVNPLHLEYYSAYLGKAAGMDLPDYSVSVPGIYIDSTTSPGIVESASRPNTTQLGLLNVKYLVSAIPLLSPGLQTVQKFGDVMVYLNPNFHPRAWLDNGQVTVTSWSPDRITLTSDGQAGTLVLSEIMYPGWQAWVDGQPAAIGTVEGLLRSVVVGEGKHEVVFEFHPLTVYIGAGVAGVGWMVFVTMFILGRRRMEKSKRECYAILPKSGGMGALVERVFIVLLASKA
jgi:hypothetical protein